MSGDDLLARAAAALRASSTPESRAGTPDAAADVRAARTRANVLLAASARTRRRKVMALVWPLAAALVLSTAWAGTHGGRARWGRVVSLFEAEHETAVTRGAPGAADAHRSGATLPEGARHAPSHAESASPAIAIAPIAPIETGSAPVDALEASRGDAANRAISPSISRRAGPARPPSTRAAASSASSVTGGPPEALGASSASDVASPETNAAALYAAAHRAHFVDRDPAAALIAWDAYLAAAPEGTLAPEARYNRGVTLVRLGRYDDARRALAPFAADTGGYRAREAKRLIDVMEAH